VRENYERSQAGHTRHLICTLSAFRPRERLVATWPGPTAPAGDPAPTPPPCRSWPLSALPGRPSGRAALIVRPSRRPAGPLVWVVSGLVPRASRSAPVSVPSCSATTSVLPHVALPPTRQAPGATEDLRQEHGRHWAVPEDVRTQVRRRLWRSDAPSAVVSSTEASASLPAAFRSVAAKSFRLVGATRIRDARQGGLSRRRSGGPAPGPTYLARQVRVQAESDFTSSWFGMFVDGVTTPGAQGDGARDR
jgi:hypothetical protein